MRVEVGVLGPVELRLDGVPAPLSGAPQRIVLARLALAAGRTVPVPDLIDTLWGDEPPDNAVGNLHSYVSRLRRHTGAEAIRREPAGYRLDLHAAAVDATRVERLVAEARDQPAGEAAETLQAAVRTWRGEPLSDVADRLAFAPEVARLTEWRRHLREECLDRRLAAGQAAHALPEIEELATAEPMRERPQLLLMRALHQTGRTAEALTVARSFRDRMIGEHGVDPGPAVAELQRRILGEDPALRPATASRPVRPDRFFGRRDELAAVRAAIAGGRVTTIAGPGGVGKTRLMTEALTGAELVIELAELAVPADVAVAVAGALGLRTAPRGGVEALAERLGSEPAVLVLDNCEHLLGAVRELVGTVIARCPGVRVLATSRLPLAVAGERVLRLGPLPAADRVDLFCDRAGLLRAGFAATPQNRALAAEVCDLVDGLPLAVELAARRESVFGLAQLRDRLGAGLTVLDPARGGDRSNAVRATVEWSYRLLDPAAQVLLDRLAVCRGGFGLDGLARLQAQPDSEPLLAELVDASLVVTDLTADPPRYRLLETVRHVGLTHLGAERETGARAAHADWMLAHVAGLIRLQAVRDPRTTPGLRRELANIQEAVQWLHDAGRRDDCARLAAGLTVVIADAPDPGVAEQLRRLAPERVETETDALLALAAGGAEWLMNHFAEADRLLGASADRLGPGHPMHWPGVLYRSANSMFSGQIAEVHAGARILLTDPAAPPWAVAMGICCAALIDSYAGDPAGAARWLDAHAAELSRGDADGFVPFTRGELAAASDPAAALGWFDVSLRMSDRIHQAYIGNIARVARASVLVRMGRPAEAAAACRDVLEAVRAAGMTTQMWIALRLTAELLGDLGDGDSAAAILAAADADPLAPVVLGADLDRQARLRRPGARPPGAGDSASVTAFALAQLRGHA